MGSTWAGTAFKMYGKRGLFANSLVIAKNGSFRESTLTRNASQRSAVTNGSHSLPSASGLFVFPPTTIAAAFIACFLSALVGLTGRTRLIEPTKRADFASLGKKH